MSASQPGAKVDGSKDRLDRPLFGANLDAVMAGGLSIVAFAVCWLFFDRAAGPYAYSGTYPYGQYVANPMILQLSFTMFCLSFVCNFPHFLMSYQLLYLDFRDQIFRDRSMAWAAVIVPLALAVGLGYAVLEPAWIPQWVRLMYALVNWHYVKQVYGVVVFTSARNQIYYTAFEKRVMLAMLASLGAMGWVNANLTDAQLDFLGYSYAGWNLPLWCLTGTQVVFCLSLFALVVVLLGKYVREGAVPPASASIALFAVLSWFLPLVTHFTFSYMIPFFHSLQYLWIATAFRNNKVTAESESLPGARRRLRYVVGFWGYLMAAGILGALVFHVIPAALDGPPVEGAPPPRPQLWMAISGLFLNIHHYFIDAVIWRRGNAQAGRYLVAH